MNFNSTITRGKSVKIAWSLRIFSGTRMLSHVCLFSAPWTVALLGSSFHEILQARIQEWVAISSSRGYSQPRDQTFVSCIGKWILHHWATRKAQNCAYHKAFEKYWLLLPSRGLWILVMDTNNAWLCEKTLQRWVPTYQFHEGPKPWHFLPLHPLLPP